MKSYWSIVGPSKAPKDHCIAFYKYDGSNLRFEWSKKNGWHKFGTRRRLFDESDPEYGRSIEMFKNVYGESLVKIFRDNKKYKAAERAVVFCEFYGPSSFAGQHVWTEQHELTLFDVDIHKKGFVLPRDFINDFGHLKTPPIVYEGNFNKSLVETIRNSTTLGEGVVCKGVLNGKGQHGLWMAKIKTSAWIQRLKTLAQTDSQFQQVLVEEMAQQKDMEDA